METVLGWQSLSFIAALNDDKKYFERGNGELNGGCAYYKIYKTKDNRFISLGALESKFWKSFCETIKKPEWINRQNESIPQYSLIEDVSNIIKTKNLLEWIKIFKNIDCCFTPILEASEVIDEEHIKFRNILKKINEKVIEISYPVIINNKVQGIREEIKYSNIDEILKKMGIKLIYNFYFFKIQLNEFLHHKKKVHLFQINLNELIKLESFQHLLIIVLFLNI